MEEKSKRLFRMWSLPSVIGVPNPLLNGFNPNFGLTLSPNRRTFLATVHEKTSESLKNWCGRWRKFRMHYFGKLLNLISNTEEKEAVLIQAEIKYNERLKFATLPKFRSKITESFREFKPSRSLFYYLLEKLRGLERLELHLVWYTIFGYAKRGTFGLPDKATEYGLAILYWFLIPIRFL